MRNTFLVALVASAAQAIKLHQNNNDANKAAKGNNAPPTVDVDPDTGIPSNDCPDIKPAHVENPICFEGEWVEFEALDDPDFWTCGAKPHDFEHATCNACEGKWEE